MRRVLARRDMRLLLGGQTLSMFGDTALWLALAVWAKTLTGSSAAAGMVMFGLSSPHLLAPLAGLRVRRRPLLIATNLATAVAVLPLLLVHDRGDVWILYAVTVVYGMSFSVLGSAQSALLATILPEDELADANGMLQTSREGLRLVAPLAGAALFTAFGGAAVALLDAATFLLAVGALLLMRVHEPPPAPRSPERLLAAITAGAQHLRHTLPLRQLTVASGAALLVIGFSETLTFEVAGKGLGRDAAFVGVLIAIQGVGAVAGAATAAAMVRRFGEATVGGLGLLVFAAGAAMLVSSSLPVVVLGKVIFGVGIPWLIVALFTLLQRTTPGPLQGRVYSAVEVFVGTPQTVSIALGALLVAFVDYRLLLLVEALVVAGAGAWLLTRVEQRVAVPH
jgi:MFS family permease